jgi:hypothetical protein
LKPAHKKILNFFSVISCSVEANPSASVILQHQLTKPNHAGISTSNVGAACINTSRDGALAHHWKVPVPGKQLISLIVMLVGCHTEKNYFCFLDFFALASLVLG